jgi:hypothetical protein
MSTTYTKAPQPTSFRIPEVLLGRLKRQAIREDRDTTSLLKILLAEALAVREVSTVRETETFKRRLVKRRAGNIKKGDGDVSVLD